jgi:F0F1-type ATP synthase epsilon subunit
MAMRQDASTGQMVDDGQPVDGTKIDGPLHVKVYSPFTTYYDADADSISAENDTGPFDVLLGHRNFLTLLNPCDIIVRRKGQDEEKISITRGLLHVHQDQVVVFLDV